MRERPEFPRVLIMSRDEAEQFIGGPNDVCISIRSVGASPANLCSSWRDVLRLYFDDVAGYDQVPDGAIDLSGEDAARVVEFALKHRDAERLVVHCEAGISRSVAIGLALSTEFAGYWAFPRWYDRERRGNRYIHNRRVFDRVVVACRRTRETVP